MNQKKRFMLLVILLLFQFAFILLTRYIYQSQF